MRKGLLNKILVLAVSAAGLAFAGAAEAASVTATFNSASPSRSLTVKFRGANQGVLAGRYHWTGDAGNPSPLNAAFRTYCIDFVQSMNFGQTINFTTGLLELSPRPNTVGSGNPTGGMGPAKADLVRRLWGGFEHTIGTNNDRAAAFQLSLWEIIYEPTGSIGSLLTGDMQVTNTSAAWVSIAHSWLSDVLNPQSEIAPATNLIALNSDSFQDQITIGPNPPPPGTTVPVPPAFLAGAALIGATWARRRGR